LGQAAPILDEISPLSTREVSSLVTRGFFSNLFHKNDPATQKLINEVSKTVHCKSLNMLLHFQTEYQDAKKDLSAEKAKVTGKGSKAVVKEYEKQIKNFETSRKKIASEIKGHESALKKLGVKDAQAHCKAPAVVKADN